MKAYEGVEHEEARRAATNGFAKPRLIAPAIEAEAWCRNDVERQGRELDSARAADAGDTRLHDGSGVLGHVDEYWPWIVDGERAKTGRSARDRDSKVEREPGFAALGRSAENADGGSCPERIDEPTREDIAVV